MPRRARVSRTTWVNSARSRKLLSESAGAGGSGGGAVGGGGAGEAGGGSGGGEGACNEELAFLENSKMLLWPDAGGTSAVPAMCSTTIAPFPPPASSPLPRSFFPLMINTSALIGQVGLSGFILSSPVYFLSSGALTSRALQIGE